ncbi:EI24 domain-containing protein [Basilea psittacipulmonis]|uniref:EI24 domain-containing protein n=1 Tax=Basilea psittacipulmonis TaxID=1472345 RepID=UPI00068EB65E|nr:EI24 domain-containing protein [Basilea psittacipulmonis]
MKNSFSAAFLDSVKTLFTPKMIFTSLWPFIFCLVCFLALLIFLPTGFIEEGIYEGASTVATFEKTNGIYLVVLKLFILAFIAFVSIIIGFAIASIFMTPMIVRTIKNSYYPDLAELGKFANTTSVLNTIKVLTIFILGWIITFPLHFTGIGIFLPIIWNAYLFTHMTKVDALVDYATKDELKVIKKNSNGTFWKIGFICSLLFLIPFVNFLVPIFSIIFCSRYALGELYDLRQPHKDDSNGPDESASTNSPNKPRQISSTVTPA